MPVGPGGPVPPVSASTSGDVPPLAGAGAGAAGRAGAAASGRQAACVDTKHKLAAMELRKIVKENHNSAILSCVGSAAFDVAPNLVATVCATQVNVYDCEHCGSFMDLMVQYVRASGWSCRGGLLLLLLVATVTPRAHLLCAGTNITRRRST